MSHQKNVQIIILAAGKGTRMHSPLPKVLHKAGGLPLLGYVFKAVESLNPQDTTVVLSPHLPEVEHYVRAHSFKPNVVYQKEPLGTAHAVLCALDPLQNSTDPILILFGDTPLIQSKTLSKMIDAFDSMSPEVAALVVGIQPQDPKNYGRIVTNEDQEVLEIVEAKEASAQILEQTLCNSGIMILNGKKAFSLLSAIENKNQSQEYYLTDIVKVARTQGHQVKLYLHQEAIELEGINNCAELAEIEAYLQRKWRQEAMAKGVSLIDPQNTYFSYDTKIASGATIYPYVFLGPGVTIETQVDILSFTHIEGTTIKEGAKIGPYARLRPGTVIDEQSRVGNFVEIKNSYFGAGSKANHLSYIGDAKVGKATNIGAGTITCNYDGHQKWPTEIGNHVSVGANCSLVAPLVIGDEAIIGAGSIVTKDVPSQALTIARAVQKNLEQKAPAYHQRIKNLLLKESH